MKKILIMIFIALFLGMSTEPILIYSRYTNHPSFRCPNNVFKCVLYQMGNKWRVNNPILRDECKAGEICSFVKLSRGGMIRWLPGDVWTSSAKFNGYVIQDGSQVSFPEKPEKIPSQSHERQETCKKICINKSIHGICMSYHFVCN